MASAFPCGGLLLVSLLLVVVCACGGFCLGACCSCLALRPHLRRGLARVLRELLEEPVRELVGEGGGGESRRRAYKVA